MQKQSSSSNSEREREKEREGTIDLIEHLHLDKLEIFKADPSLSVNWLNNMYLFWIHQLFTTREATPVRRGPKIGSHGSQ